MLTYTDGANSVKVTGTSEITLKFCGDGSEQHAMLAQAGASLDFAAERIFEEMGKDTLATL